MNKKRFERLRAAIREAGAVRRGAVAPSRGSSSAVPDLRDWRAQRWERLSLPTTGSAPGAECQRGFRLKAQRCWLGQLRWVGRRAIVFSSATRLRHLCAPPTSPQPRCGRGWWNRSTAVIQRRRCRAKVGLEAESLWDSRQVRSKN